MADMTKVLEDVTRQKGMEIDGLFERKQVKDCRNWRFEIPAIGDDLEFQIFFKEHFGDLLSQKKIAKLIKGLDQALSDSKFAGEFKIDVLMDARAVIIAQAGYWKRFDASPNDLVAAIEAVCEKIF